MGIKARIISTSSGFRRREVAVLSGRFGLLRKSFVGSDSRRTSAPGVPVISVADWVARIRAALCLRQDLGCFGEIGEGGGVF